MQQIVTAVGWFFLASTAFGGLAILTATVVGRLRTSRRPQIVGAELPMIDVGIDLGKWYDVVYGAGHGETTERLAGVRIVGYLRSDRDQATGEYMDGRWLVVELPDGRRAYLRPRSVLWLLEAAPGSAGESDRAVKKRIW